MGCNASKVPLAVVDIDDNNGNRGRNSNSKESRRVSALDFTTSTDFFRRSSSLLLWKPHESPRSKKKKSVFELFKEQVNQEDIKQAKEQEKEELKKKLNTSLSSSAVRCHYDSNDSNDADNIDGDTTTNDEVVSALDLK